MGDPAAVKLTEIDWEWPGRPTPQTPSQAERAKTQAILEFNNIFKKFTRIFQKECVRIDETYESRVQLAYNKKVDSICARVIEEGTREASRNRESLINQSLLFY